MPRTVYMPYVPHVPVAPARLSMATPAARVIETEERRRDICPEPQAPRDLPSQPRDTRVTDALDKCLDEMRKLNGRISDLETRTQRAVAPPPPCPVPCPTPGPYFVPGPCPTPGAMPFAPVYPGTGALVVPGPPPAGGPPMFPPLPGP